jgi:hypothetical protein
LGVKRNTVSLLHTLKPHSIRKSTGIGFSLYKYRFSNSNNRWLRAFTRRNGEPAIALAPANPRSNSNTNSQ